MKITHADMVRNWAALPMELKKHIAANLDSLKEELDDLKDLITLIMQEDYDD